MQQCTYASGILHTPRTDFRCALQSSSPVPSSQSSVENAVACCVCVRFIYTCFYVQYVQFPKQSSTLYRPVYCKENRSVFATCAPRTNIPRNVVPAVARSMFCSRAPPRTIVIALQGIPQSPIRCQVAYMGHLVASKTLNPASS